MTVLLLSALGFGAVVALYLATASARAREQPGDFLDAGLSVPTWVLIFAGAGVTIAALGLRDHLLLIASYGLQYNEIAIGIIIAAIASALVQKRTWLASRITSLRTAGDLLGAY